MKRLLVTFLVAAALAVAPSATSADTLTFELDTLFSDGSTPPDGATPWLTATFAEIGGDIQLTLSASGLTDPESVDNWFFNYAGDVDDLTFTYQSGVTATVSQEQSGAGNTGFKADGDGYFDIFFEFAQQDFNAGETSVWLIEGATLNLFDDLSSNTGAWGPFTSAAHINSTGLDNEGSAWIADGGGDDDGGEEDDIVAEPTTLLLLGSGLVAVSARFRRRRENV